MSALKTEITTGPLAAELGPPYAAGNDVRVADVLNRVDRPYRRPIDITVLSGFCAATNVTGKVLAALAVPMGTDISLGKPMTQDVSAGLHTVTTIILMDFRLTSADLDDPAVAPILDLLSYLGILTPALRAAMLGLMNATRSRAAELGWPAVTSDAVYMTRSEV